MKIFESAGLTCFLESDEIIKINKNKYSIGSEVFELVVSGCARIIWPNREGEGFDIGSVYPVLKANGCLESGLAISWPATASAEAVMIEAPDGKRIIFQTIKETAGLHREMRIFSDGPAGVRLKISGAPSVWKLIDAEPLGMKSGSEASQRIDYQFQVGFIDPWGNTEAQEGFGLLSGLAGRFTSLIEKQGVEVSGKTVIHIFGYAAGHDMGYPDYTPAESLGGKAALAAAAESLHRQGCMLSCYLNARIAEEETLERYPQLKKGICRASDGEPVIEVYRGRRFNIMEPGFEPWLKHLYTQALMLAECGADAVQLDQIAGRAPVVAPGDEWGAGYHSLIERIRAAGLKVWIQGVTDYYPADWHEMAYRFLSILPGGTLRGGNPFGETDLGLLSSLYRLGSFSGDASFLVPLHKARRIDSLGLPLIIDVLTIDEDLPIYGRKYLEILSRLERDGIAL